MEGEADHPLQVLDGDERAKDGPDTNGLPFTSMDQLNKRRAILQILRMRLMQISPNITEYKLNQYSTFCE